MNDAYQTLSDVNKQNPFFISLSNAINLRTLELVDYTKSVIVEFILSIVSIVLSIIICDLSLALIYTICIEIWTFMNFRNLTRYRSSSNVVEAKTILHAKNINEVHINTEKSLHLTNMIHSEIGGIIALREDSNTTSILIVVFMLICVLYSFAIK